MVVPGYRDNPIQAWDSTAPVDPGEATDFLRLCYTENPRLGPVEPRVAMVRAQIAATGGYVHTPEELAYGARIAWRNASRCIGRLYWRSLVVFDRRWARSAEQIYAQLVRHMEAASGVVPISQPDSGARPDSGTRPDADARSGAGVEDALGEHRPVGAIRPVISVFAPATPGRPSARVWNEQLIRYAGYRNENGGVIGDPAQERFTAAMQRHGWRGKGEAFDILPLAIETPDGGVQLYDLPERAVLEVPLEHPQFSWFAELGLRWHAVPAISNMRLSIGGINYPLAPFNGWYMGAEIGSRNLGDDQRYNMLPVVAWRMGLDMSRESTLWRDQAIVELNRAVLFSFEKAGVKVTDHHTESARFLTHLRNEERAGRQVPADWSWIVPPLSGSATPVFHRYYYEADQRPSFYLDDEARTLARTGAAARCPLGH